MTYLDNSNIPEEYKEQIAQLIESNDENNWNLVYELLKGFNKTILSEFAFECKFRVIMRKYSWQRMFETTYYQIRFYIDDRILMYYNNINHERI